MIGKIFSAALGRRLAGPNAGGRGAALGYLAPAIARRMSPPVAMLLGGAWVARKLWTRRRDRAGR
jgi:hypothetical protein